LKGFLKNPFFYFFRHKSGRLSGGFYFGLVSFVLFGLLFFSSDSLAEPNYSPSSDTLFFNSFFKDADNLAADDLFFGQQQSSGRETPDLKIIQDNSIAAVSTPNILTTQTLGDVFGTQEEQRKDVIDYAVQPGDTVESIAKNFNVSVNTLLWANSISKNTSLKASQTLVILPVSGIMHIVKNGDTISQISKTYKAKVDDVISFNNLAGEGDIFIGDTLIIPEGILPQKLTPSIHVPLADNFFIFPAEGHISQRLHFYNAVDLANKCGTPIYAAASGVVQRAVANGKWNLGMGNHVTILHTNGTVTYYGHLMNLFVKSGERVSVGDRIGLMGGAPGMLGAGKSTGCHVHFQVTGASNPLAKYAFGAIIKYKQ